MARNKYDVDEILEDRFDLNQLKRLGGYIAPYKKQMTFVIFIMLSASALTMLIPQFFMKVLDECIPAGDMKAIGKYCVFTFIIALYSSLSLRYKIRVTNHIGQNIIHKLRYDIFEHLQRLPFSYYDDRPHGKIQVRVVNYVNSLSDLLSNGIINTITDLCNLIFILIFMLLINVRLTLLCLCGLPVLAAVVVLIKKKQRRAWQIQSNKQSNLNAYIAESINGIRVTQSFTREEKNTDIFNHLSSGYRQSWMRAVKFNFLMGPSVDIISAITTSFVYVLGIYWMTGGGQNGITVGVLTAFTAYISRFWNPINTLASFYNSLLTAISYLERIFETIDEEVLVKDLPGASEMPPIVGKIEFRDVSFSYEEGHPILNRIRFTASPGDSFAIVGPTGAGKTTIVNLISRFYDVQDGTVSIDGYDVKKVSIESLRKQMGIMTQDNFLFSGTIKENIRYGKLDATDEEIVAAAKAVNAHDFIIKLEKGYDTELSERGGGLSIGQKQLLAFARTMVSMPKILILDEATSSIDTKTELLVQSGIENLLKGRTSFVIAHRLSTIQKADRIFVIDDGRIMEEGNAKELLEKKGTYYHLYMAQFAV